VDTVLDWGAGGGGAEGAAGSAVGDRSSDASRPPQAAAATATTTPIIRRRPIAYKTVPGKAPFPLFAGGSTMRGPMISRTRAAVCLLVGALAVTVAASSASGRPAELTPIKVAILPLEPTATAMYAKQRAMFRKQGLDAELKMFSDPSQVLGALLSGQVQFAGTHVGLAAKLKSDGAPVKVVAAGAIYNPKKPTSLLVSAKGKTIAGPRALAGKTIAIDFPNTIADLGVKKWLEDNGVDLKDVKLTYVPFPLMLGPLEQGTVDAGFLPEPYLTQAIQNGAKRIANPFQAVCTKACQLTFWLARADVDENVRARFRNAIQNASVWANEDKNDRVSGRILAKFTGIDEAVIRTIVRTTFGTRLRVSLAKEWLPVFARYGVIPASFKPIDLVK
jgi:NitT/TauT family transport system substrate-binding protein